MRTKKALFQKKTWMKEILGIVAMLLIFSLNGFICEAASGKVTAETANIRAEANTTSEVIGSTEKGKTVDIVGAVKDASGTVWYKVPNGNNTYGYIRSDLIETSDTIEITTASTASSNSNESTAKPAETVPTPIEEKQAAVSVEKAVVRTGASKQHDSIISLPKGTGVTLVGEASDGSGNKWYQITCEYNGRSIKGYVRSDLVTIGAPASAGGENNNAGGENGGDSNTDANSDGNADGENGGEQTGGEAEGGGDSTEGEGNEQPSEAPQSEHNDYEVVYDDETYWLYDNTNGTMMSVTNLLQVVDQANENSESLQSQVKNGKIIIIVLAVIIVLLVAAVTVLIFKLRDAYYYEEEYEEEEEEEEEEIPVEPKKKKKPVVEESEEEPAPPRKKKVRDNEMEPEAERPEKRRTSQNAELQATEKKQTVKKTSQRKAQNFLVDDDEFEFEFLNMDDKDL